MFYTHVVTLQRNGCLVEKLVDAPFVGLSLGSKQARENMVTGNLVERLV